MNMVSKYKERQKNGYTPKEFCDKLSKNFKDLTKTLYLSNTDFIRTTEKGIRFQ